MNRDQFEKWFEKNLGAHSCQFDKDSDGNYEERDTICAWYAWKEQQEKIENLIQEYSAQSDPHNQGVNDLLSDIIVDLKGLLK